MKKGTLYLLSLLGLLFLAGCQHETDFFDGPSIVDQYGDFRLVESLAVSQPQVDFANGEKVFFTAQFNKNVNWELTITGTESGSRKVITGLSRELNAENTSWDGGTTAAPLFRAEPCEVTLLVPSADSLLLSTTVETLSGKLYDAITLVDFETDPGASLFFGNFEFELANTTGIQDDIPAAQGEKYYLFEGNDNVVPNFFAGLIRIDATVGGNTYFPVPDPDPAQVYFNTFLWHDRTPYTIAVIVFYIDTNNDGVFTEGVDQSRQLEGDYPLNHEGWRLFSHSMADLGMTSDEMEKLVTIEIVLISDMNSQPTPSLPVRFGIDYLNFTAGQPFAL
jgi:hypothetical protein